jgi:urease gamma subunit
MHTQKDEKKTVRKCRKLIDSLLKDYVLVQRELSESICTKKISKKKFLKALDKMDRLEGRLDQMCKTYRLLFNETPNHKSLLRKAVKKNYPLAYQFVTDKIKEERGHTNTAEEVMNFTGNIPEDAPEEIKEIFAAIKGAVSKLPSDKQVKFGMMDMRDPEQTFGLNPADFNNFGDFLKGVAKAKKKAESIKKGDLKAEDVINEAIIHNAEHHQNGEETASKKPEKLN